MTKSYIERKTEGFEEVKVPADNEDGFTVELRYTAPYYQYGFMPLEKARLIHVVLELLKLCIMVFGYTRYSGANMYTNSAKLAAIALVPEMFCILGIVFFLLSEKLLFVAKYREIRNTIYMGSGLSGILLLVSSVGCICYATMAKVSDLSLEILTVVLYLVAALLAFALAWLQRERCYAKINNNEAEKES